MESKKQLISTGNLTRRSLAGQNGIITGAGGGIGFEAARALIWLGARVVIAEIDAKTGRRAAECLNQEFGPGSALFIQTDVGDERSVRRLVEQVGRSLGQIDFVLNNATVAPLGAVQDLPIQDWDASYRVNLRGPALLARACLPGMLARRKGAFVCVSSTGMQYMAAYESMKAAQVHLANTLASEIEGSSVSAFTIGPGFAPTHTASSAIPKLAGMMGKSAEEVLASIGAAAISVEAAGAGFAAAVALAERYHGLEIASMASLIDAGIDLDDSPRVARTLSPEKLDQVHELTGRVRATLAEQSADWKRRSIFEQQWLVRSFKQSAGKPVEQWLDLLGRLESTAEQEDGAGVLDLDVPLAALARYYAQLAEMARGYVKDPLQREEQLAIVHGWQSDCETLDGLLND
ncbi:MAG TPA: SDR family oxidoreductase [Anaerolineaceae bacterium]|jgi:NAD(P)-dependent dehydrogenase (short-subunit alcohol dehydrogenase family)